jgi:hypothetical protein
MFHETVKQLELTSGNRTDPDASSLCVKPSRPHGARHVQDRVVVDTAVGFPGFDPDRPAMKLGREPGFIFCEGRGKVDQVVVDARRRFAKLRQDHVPHTVPQVDQVPIRAVLDPTDTMVFEPAEDLASTNVEQGPDDGVFGGFSNAGQRPRTRTTQQLEDHTFGNIIAVVRCGHSGRAVFFGELQ